MLLLIEVFDTITGIFVLTELCLVLFGVEFGRIVPKLQHLDVHCLVKVQCQASGAPLRCEGAAPTFVHGVGDLVKFTTIALVGGGLGSVGNGEAWHCREVTRKWLAVFGGESL